MTTTTTTTMTMTMTNYYYLPRIASSLLLILLLLYFIVVAHINDYHYNNHNVFVVVSAFTTTTTTSMSMSMSSSLPLPPPPSSPQSSSSSQRQRQRQSTALFMLMMSSKTIEHDDDDDDNTNNDISSACNNDNDNERRRRRRSPSPRTRTRRSISNPSSSRRDRPSDESNDEYEYIVRNGSGRRRTRTPTSSTSNSSNENTRGRRVNRPTSLTSSSTTSSSRSSSQRDIDNNNDNGEDIINGGGDDGDGYYSSSSSNFVKDDNDYNYYEDEEDEEQDEATMIDYSNNYDDEEYDDDDDYNIDDEENYFTSDMRKINSRWEVGEDEDDNEIEDERYYYDDEEDNMPMRYRRQTAREKMSDRGSSGSSNSNSNSNSNSTNIYKVVFSNDDVSPFETELTWETCNYNPSLNSLLEQEDDEYDDYGYNDRPISRQRQMRRKKQLDDTTNVQQLPDEKTEAIVLLPPASVERPTAVIHFVGGTFFGSRPKLFYGKLLEDIVRHTNVAVIVTPIPVTLTKSPLDHLRLTTKLQKSFDYAWTTVLEDEYLSENDDSRLADVPVCAMGHSLGARLLTVLTTKDQNKPSSRGRKIPPYKSMILISFTNFGANAGIPGISALLRQSRRIDENERRRRRRRQKHLKVKTAAQAQLKNNRNSRRSRAAARRRRMNNDWSYDNDGGRFDNVGGVESSSDYEFDDDYDDDDDDIEWEEFVDSVQSFTKQQAERIRTALTPKSRDLEFRPSPDQLWQALEDDGRYNVSQTLVVQFDDDTIDQGAKLAQILYDTNSSSVKFARLRGTHVTPLSIISDDDPTSEGRKRRRNVASLQGGAVNSNNINPSLPFIYNKILGRSKTRDQVESLRILRQSIVSYITDVVTK